MTHSISSLHVDPKQMSKCEAHLHMRSCLYLSWAGDNNGFLLCAELEDLFYLCSERNEVNVTASVQGENSSSTYFLLLWLNHENVLVAL